MLQENQSNNHRQIFAREMTNKSLKMEGNKHLGLKIRRGCDKDTLPTRTGARHTVPPIESACLITHTSQKKKKKNTAQLSTSQQTDSQETHLNRFILPIKIHLLLKEILVCLSLPTQSKSGSPQQQHPHVSSKS